MFNKCGTDTNSETHAASSKELLYSDIMGITDAEHALKLFKSKKESKPVMQFQSSSAMDRVKKLLPLLEQGQNELNEKPSEVNNIEVIEGESFIEMNVALMKNLNGDTNDSKCEPDEFAHESNEDMYESNEYMESNFEDYEDLSDSSDSGTESESEDSPISELSDECQSILNDNQHSETLISAIKEEPENSVLKDS